jgi:hypothetical protein
MIRIHTAEVAGSIPASPTLEIFHFQIERRQERNREDVLLFRHTLTLLDDILADLRNGLRVWGRELMLAQ